MRATIPLVSGLAALAALCALDVARAQQPPSRIDNQANGLSYQPTNREVKSREKQAGIEPDKNQQQHTLRTINRLDRQLLGPGTRPLGKPE